MAVNGYVRWFGFLMLLATGWLLAFLLMDDAFKHVGEREKTIAKHPHIPDTAKETERKEIAIVGPEPESALNREAVLGPGPETGPELEPGFGPLIHWPPVIVDKREWGLFYEADRSEPGFPDPELLPKRLAAAGLKLGAPIFMRIFKEEHVLEVWIKNEGRFQRFGSYPVCTWSGALGPKLMEGDRQAPEGFYTVSKGQLNPNSQYFRSFNLGYPNLFDRSHERTGSYLMVHGSCVSLGCYAMTDPIIAEIWTLVTAALEGGQKRFHVHAYPFRMSKEKMEEYAHNEWSEFWGDLKQGYDLFEESYIPPVVSVCDKRYEVRAGKHGSNGNTTVRAFCARKTAQGD